MAFYTTPTDVANRALQHLGIPRITTLADATKEAAEVNFVLDKLRAAELQKSVWTFAVRRVMMRAVVGGSSTIVFPLWLIATTYAGGDVVKDANGYLWLSVTNSNTGNVPGAGGAIPSWVAYSGPFIAQAWDTTVAYVPGDMVYTSTVCYICVLAHTGHAQPNATYWHVVVSATLSAGVVGIAQMPIGFAPNGTLAKTIYRLPANYQRMASQDPKSPASVQLNTTAAMRYNDWEIENGFLFTKDTPFVMRFVADQTDVTIMESIFCEVWAARIAVELAETMTQSAEKLNNCLGLYTRYTRIAKIVNAIEGGSSEDEPDEAPAAPGGR